MKVDIITHPEFEREFRRLSKKYHSLVDDYAQLIEDLENHRFKEPLLVWARERSVWVLVQKEEARVVERALSLTLSCRKLLTSWN